MLKNSFTEAEKAEAYHKPALASVMQTGKSPAKYIIPSLSKNELVFLTHCCSELTYKEIADKMFVSPRTIDNYRESLFQKLVIKSRTGLVLYAIQHGVFKF